MDKYTVILSARAVRDLKQIYAYISDTLLAPKTAENMLDGLRNEIFSLEWMPYRNPKRQRGHYAGTQFRNLFYKNYTIIYRVEEAGKRVIISTVQYSRRNL